METFDDSDTYSDTDTYSNDGDSGADPGIDESAELVPDSNDVAQDIPAVSAEPPPEPYTEEVRSEEPSPEPVPEASDDLPGPPDTLDGPDDLPGLPDTLDGPDDLTEATEMFASPPATASDDVEVDPSVVQESTPADSPDEMALDADPALAPTALDPDSIARLPADWDPWQTEDYVIDPTDPTPDLELPYEWLDTLPGDAPAPTEEGVYWAQGVTVADVGDAQDDAKYWFFQGDNKYCEPSAVAMIVADFTDNPDAQNLQDDVVSLADRQGMFVKDDQGHIEGMPRTSDAAVLLTQLGVPAHYLGPDAHNDIHTLEGFLAENRSILIAVDSGDIWGGANDDGKQAPDHVVNVIGIDHKNGLVLLNDTGSPGGKMEEVPLKTFLQAWGTSGNEIVVTDQPEPEGGQPAPSPTSVETTAPAPQVEPTPATPVQPTPSHPATPIQPTTPSQPAAPTQTPIQPEPTTVTPTPASPSQFALLPIVLEPPSVDELNVEVDIPATDAPETDVPESGSADDSSLSRDVTIAAAAGIAGGAAGVGGAAAAGRSRRRRSKPPGSSG